ncbi:MAG: dicarboxylate/amino acid:cation symporter [Candidatus Cryptobacteroides sp.]
MAEKDSRQKKHFRIGLLPRIFIAIALGIGAGFIFPEFLVRIFLTFNSLFSSFLNFTIPLIILALVAPAIADIGKGAGKMLLVTVALAYAFTLFSGFLAYGVAQFCFPPLLESNIHIAAPEHSEALQPYFSIDFPPLFGVMTALVAAFLFGIGMTTLQTSAMKDFFGEMRTIISKVISAVIIPLLPLYIFGIFLNMTYTGQVGNIMSVFVKIIAVIFALHVFLLILQFCIAGAISHKNPFKALWHMLPAYFTALGTQSSAATIPVTMKQTIYNGVDEGIAGFTVPLCATIHLSGSTMKITCCAIALMMIQGIPYDFGMMAGFICMLGVTMVAAPGVPGGAIMAALGILSSMLGFGETDLALMIALYIAMDSFGTACNVTGDGAISLIVDRIFKKHEINVNNEGESCRS